MLKRTERKAKPPLQKTQNQQGETNQDHQLGKVVLGHAHVVVEALHAAVRHSKDKLATVFFRQALKLRRGCGGEEESHSLELGLKEKRATQDSNHYCCA